MVTRDQRHTRPIRISHVQIRIHTSPSQVKRKKQLKNKAKRHNYFSQPIDKAKKMCYNNLRLKIKRVKNQHFRGVAQLVARQFRVLEAASSSPATSTKKTDIPFGMSVFCFGVASYSLPLCGCEFAYPSRRSASLLVRRREWIYS